MIDPPLSATASEEKKGPSRWVDGRCFRPWHTDRVRGKSSFDIVMPWLTNKANYARWKRSASSTLRAMICAEINELLRAEGILHRSVEGIRRKIINMEKDMAEAQRSLSQNGFRGLTTLEGCDQKIKDEVLAICPDFELLAPVMSTYRVHVDKGRLQDKKRLGQKVTSGSKLDRLEPAKPSSQCPHIDKTPIKSEPGVTRKSARAFRKLESSHALEVKIQQGRLKLEREKRALEMETARKKSQLDLKQLARSKIRLWSWIERSRDRHCSLPACQEKRSRLFFPPSD